MYHLIYVSSAVNLFSSQELKDLLEVSRRNNSKVGITGLLLYLEGNFIQVLEGEEEQVIQTHNRIATDPRHQGLLTLIQGETQVREFGDWSMGFKNVDANEAESMPGYSDFLQKRTDQSARKSAALRLLDNFKTINR